MTAPVASGWSGCRVGLTPTGKRRLSTAHTLSEHGRHFSTGEPQLPFRRGSLHPGLDLLPGRSGLRSNSRSAFSFRAIVRDRRATVGCGCTSPELTCGSPRPAPNCSSEKCRIHNLMRPARKCPLNLLFLSSISTRTAPWRWLSEVDPRH